MKKINTLIIEDRPDDIELLLLELDRDGIEYDWWSVETKEGFLKHLTPDIDIILADYNLPQFSAPEALKLLQESDVDAPFIVVTGSISEEVAVACMKDGAADYLIKDRLSRLGGAIRQALEKRNLERVQKEAEILRIELEKERELRELKSRFVSMVVHDFRNPLASIQISAEILKLKYDRMEAEKIEERFNVILSQTSHLGRLVDEVLLIGSIDAKGNNFSPQLGDLVEFSQSLFDEFVEHVDPSRHNPQFHVNGEAREIEFDQDLMERVLYNLLSNAVKYSPDGGKISMELSFDPNHAKISVSDDGIGISAKDQKFLFDSFHRASNVGKIPGSGLGLAIVKQIAEMHGGQVGCSSEENIGSTFTLDLPYDHAQQVAQISR
ncbi:MAG: hybrid sensor histidine kinase/response regulator [Chloroflexota bacterium]